MTARRLILPLSLAVAVSAAAILHAGKIKGTTEDADRLRKDLQGLQAHLKPGTNISVLDHSNQATFFTQLRYLYPVVRFELLAYMPQADTLLVVGDPADSTLRSYKAAAQAIIWSHSDSIKERLLLIPGKP